MPCPRCGEPAIGPDGICRNCGLAAYNTAPPPYPAPQPYPYAAGYPTPYQLPPPARRNVRGLGTALRVLLGLNAFFCAGLAMSLVWRHQLISDLLTGGGPQLNTVRLDDNLVRWFAIGLALAALTCAVLLMCWLFAARTNAGTYTTVPFSFGRGWTIGAWFIPMASLVLPLLVTREIYKATVTRPGEQQRSGGALTGWWWGLWVAGYVALWGGLKASTSNETDSLHTLQKTAIAVLPGLLLLMAAALVLMALVRKISVIQTARSTEPPFSSGFQPGYGQPGYGQPGFGAPGYGQPGFGQPANPYPPTPM